MKNEKKSNQMHVVRRLCWVLIMCSCSFWGVAQLPAKASPQVIASCGTALFGGGLKLDFTLGEYAIYTLKSGENLQATQGFHQGNLKITTSIQSPRYKSTLHIYPNPTTNFVTVEIADDEAEAFLFDIRGVPISTHTFHQKTQINMSDLPSGMYVLQVINKDKLIATSTIQKF